MASKRKDMEQILQACLNLIQNRQETVDSALARYPEQADEVRPLLEAASWLYGQRDVFAPRPEFVAESRQRLMARLELEKTSNRAQAPPARAFGLWDALVSLFTQKRFAYRFAIATLLVVLLVVSTSGVAAAAQWSIPGDALYPVKTSFEQAQLALTFSEAHRAQLYITFAERRLIEIQNLVIENRFEYLPSTIDQFGSQAKEASRLLRDLGKYDAARAKELAGELTQLLREQTAILPVLMQVTPQDSQPEIERLMALTMAVELDAQSIEISPSGTLTPTATTIFLTATLSSPIPGSPTPETTATVVATPMPAVTYVPLATPTPGATAVPTVMTSASTRTPVPTVYIQKKPPTATPTRAQPTRKVTKTRKPHPDTPRKTPKK